MRCPWLDRRPQIAASVGVCLALVLALPEARGQTIRGAAGFPYAGDPLSVMPASVLETSSLDATSANGGCQPSCVQPCCEPACVQSCCVSCCPSWTVRADALFLHRSDYNRLPLAFADNGAGEPADVLLDAEDLDFDYELGPRISVIRRFCDCNELELSFFAIDSWRASGSVTGTTAAPIHVQLPGFIQLAPAGQATFLAGSDLYSTELNYRRRAAPWLSWLVGFRWVEFGDDLSLVFDDGAGPNTIYTTDTNNHLYGLQLGADAALWSMDRLRMDSWIKAGIYTNVADQSTSVPVLPAGAGADKTNTAFLGELGVNLVYQLTDRLGVRGGYQAMWLEGVALAPDQLRVTDVTVPVAFCDTDGGLFFHGGFVGLEAVW
jgi:hypothetical protein